jgi:thiamine biosynthesis lipoprotein
MTRRSLLTTAVPALIGAAGAGEPRAPQRWEFISPHMGTLWRLVFFTDDAPRASAARDAAWRLVDAHDRTLSDYRDDSEVNRLCRAGGLDRLSPVLEAVLRQSLKLAELTDGAFDPTVGPLVRLWRASRKSGELPAAAALSAARARVGWRLVELSDPPGAAAGPASCRLAREGMQLDFGGIAKGFAQDAVLRLLREDFGLTRALIDAGGGASAGDPPPGGDGWSVALGAPADPSGEGAAPVVSLANRSLATSGDAHQFVDIGGQRFSHIVDPVTGLGLTHRVQANAVAADGAVADALATAFCVLGEPRTREFLHSRSDVVARLVTTRPDGQSRRWQSKGFDRLTRPR